MKPLRERIEAELEQIELAPHKGEDTRRLIARQAEETRDQVVKAVDGIAARRGKAAPEEAEAA